MLSNYCADRRIRTTFRVNPIPDIGRFFGSLLTHYRSPQNLPHLRRSRAGYRYGASRPRVHTLPINPASFRRRGAGTGSIFPRPHGRHVRRYGQTCGFAGAHAPGNGLSGCGVAEVEFVCRDARRTTDGARQLVSGFAPTFDIMIPIPPGRSIVFSRAPVTLPARKTRLPTKRKPLTKGSGVLELVAPRSRGTGAK